MSAELLDAPTVAQVRLLLRTPVAPRVVCRGCGVPLTAANKVRGRRWCRACLAAERHAYYEAHREDWLPRDRQNRRRSRWAQRARALLLALSSCSCVSEADVRDLLADWPRGERPAEEVAGGE